MEFQFKSENASLDADIIEKETKMELLSNNNTQQNAIKVDLVEQDSEFGIKVWLRINWDRMGIGLHVLNFLKSS